MCKYRVRIVNKQGHLIPRCIVVLDVTIALVDLGQKLSTRGRGTNWCHRLTNPSQTDDQVHTRDILISGMKGSRIIFKFEDYGAEQFLIAMSTVCGQARTVLW